MEYIYAAMLLHASKKEVNEANLKKVLEAASVKVEEGRVKALVSALEGVNIDEAIKEAAVPMMAAPVANTPSAQHSTAPQAKKEEKKSEEEAAASLSSLFG